MGDSGEHHTYHQSLSTDHGNGLDDSAGLQAYLHAGAGYGGGKNNRKSDFESGFVLLDEDQIAKPVVTRAQLVSGGGLLALFALFVWLHPAAAILSASVLFSVFYVAVAVFRAAVLAGIDRIDAEVWGGGNGFSEAMLPPGDYVILVPLYREAGQIGDLIAALDRLKWRAGRKHVHLLLEHDDVETIAAVAAELPKAGFHLEIVPPGMPRTKPRALNHALQKVHGDYLVIYDAEDRPHPLQLVEAATVFLRSEPDLACLQAPLVVDNRHASWLACLYAMEYDTLFCGMLPTLARWRAPIPLGGTSNHFIFAKLLEAGGWDSFNVTEDADLGMRLARHRMLCGTITTPTMEEAPARLRPWLFQRTRWTKGWMQTLLVHMRSPVRTAREMGLRNYALFHVILISLVVSVLVHPVFLAAYAYQMARFFSGTSLSAVDIAMAGISNFNLVAGYTTYCLLVVAVEFAVIRPDRRAGRSVFWILLFPFYWLLISLAGWRALFQLIFGPHVWEKTEHGSSDRRAPDWQKNGLKSQTEK